MNVYAVIHYVDDLQAITNASKARAHGCAGVFLIDMMGNRHDRVVNCAKAIATIFPDLPVGINHLGMNAQMGMAETLAAGLHMTWVDECVTHTTARNERYSDPKAILAMLANHPKHQLFIGCAFKYQPVEPNPEVAASAIARMGCITTTSGPATGVAADINKLKAIKAAIGSCRLAVASGVSPSNIADMKGIVDDVLVASSITTTDGTEMIIDEQLAALMRAIT